MELCLQIGQRLELDMIKGSGYTLFQAYNRSRGLFEEQQDTENTLKITRVSWGTDAKA